MKHHLLLISIAFASFLFFALMPRAGTMHAIGQQIGSQDVDSILERADKLLSESKAAYESARERNLVESFVEAGFKLEEARIKYLVLQEIAPPEKQKLATDRLRAVNQLAKLIHDGKVAVMGSPAEVPVPKPAEPATPPATAEPKNPPPPLKAPADVTTRYPIPEAAKQREAEKVIKELFKDQYAKKGAADRQSLARILLDQVARMQDDPVAMWVLFREAQEVAVQAADVKTALEAVDGVARIFDVDGMALKSTVLSGIGKAAKSADEFLILAESVDKLVEELMAADLYDNAEKAATTALQFARRANDARLVARAASRAKEVSEAKTRFASMKGVLETLARTPDDPAANLEMGQFLCFVKANWDLGIRFLAKGSDASMKSLAQREISLLSQPAETSGVADGWWEVAEKEKSPLRKNQMTAHAKTLYEMALPTVSGLTRAKIEKRLADQEQASGGNINLLRLIDPKIDAVSGDWKMEGGILTCSATGATRLQIPYQPPDEYDVSVTLVRRSGIDAILFGLVGSGSQFAASIDAFSTQGGASFLEIMDGGAPLEKNPSATKGTIFISGSQPYTVVYSVRKKGVTVTVNAKRAIFWEGDYRRLSLGSIWKIPDPKALFIGSWGVELQVSKMVLTPITGQGKKLR
jgi:hypothetical protein